MIGEDDWMANKTLKALNLRQECLIVLGIDRDGRDGDNYLGSPNGNALILPLDLITVYGKSEVIKSIFKRKKDYGAEQEHHAFVKKELDRLDDQNESMKED